MKSVNGKLIDRLALKIEKGKNNLRAGAVYFYSLSMPVTSQADACTYCMYYPNDIIG